MNFNDARKILGLGPDEDPRPFLKEFGQARERIAEMVRNAPNETLAARYQDGLVEFDKAIAALHEYLDALGLSRAAPASSCPAPPAEETPAVTEDPVPAAERPRRALAWILGLAVFLTGSGGGGLLYLKNEERKSLHHAERIAFLERQGGILIENRRWQDAARSFAEIEALSPGSELAKLGRRSIEAGMTEEQNQFVGYWTGQAIAELDVGRLDEAQAAANKVLERFPGEAETPIILKKIADARAGRTREESIATARRLLNESKWPEAITTAKRVIASHADDPDARSIIAEAEAAIEKARADRDRARSLLADVIARDQGQRDQELLDILREAASLAPDNSEIAERLEKMSAYTRTLRVPGDFATPAEALENSRANDRIVLAAQTWPGPLVIKHPLELQGAGAEKTIISCPADAGSAITIAPEAKGVRIAGITFRHSTFLVEGGERFSAALVSGGGADFLDCGFVDASGHGLAVIDGGQASARRCRFADNGWNGAAAMGAGSSLEIRESEASNNFENGFETWNNATASLVDNRCEGNSRNGIHTDNGKSTATITGNRLIANREFGMVLGSAGSGKASDNSARSNLLGGYVVRAAAAAVSFGTNTATNHSGPGLVIEKGLSAAGYSSNTFSGNKPDIQPDADLLDQPAGTPPPRE
jgi:tetratricopeptide (TPR) repeat protein